MFTEARAQRLRLLLIAGLLAPAVMVLVGLGLAFLSGKRPQMLLSGATPAAAGMGALATALSMGLVWSLYRLHPRLEEALRASGMRVGMEALEVAGYPVMIVVVTAAAIGEEILFRGGLQPLIGVVPAALLFGFSHGGWRREMWAYMVAASLSGTVFGLAYWLTGNIWVPVAGHALHNILSTVFMGKKVDVTWEGWFPRVRLLPEPAPDDEELLSGETPDDEALPPEETPVQDESHEAAGEEVAAVDELDQPVSATPDSPDAGPDDGDSANRRPE